MTRGSDHHKAQISTSKTVKDLTGIDLEWKQHGACQGSDPNLWFPEGTAPAKAVALCTACPVQARCLYYAIEASEIYGVWGGKSGRELVRIRRNKTKRLMARIASELEAGKGAENAAH